MVDVRVKESQFCSFNIQELNCHVTFWFIISTVFSPGYSVVRKLITVRLTLGLKLTKVSVSLHVLKHFQYNQSQITE